MLWEADEPMIASEIVKAREDLNVNTVQAALRSLVRRIILRWPTSFTAVPYCQDDIKH